MQLLLISSPLLGIPENVGGTLPLHPLLGLQEDKGTEPHFILSCLFGIHGSVGVTL